MNIQPTAFQRKDITRRQLRAEDPEAVRALDRYGGDSVGAIRYHLDWGRSLSLEDRNTSFGFATAAGAAALVVGYFNPWIGLGIGGVAGALAYRGYQQQGEMHRFERAGERLDELAARTEKGLVTTQPDGSVIDRRFSDRDQFHDPQEVSKDGQVIRRSVRVELADDEIMTAEADVAKGTVTVRGSLGESTFPGTLELPHPDHPDAVVTRTDAQPCGYEKAELDFGWRGEVGLGLVHSNGAFLGNAGSYRGIGNGVFAAWDDQGHGVLLKAPLRSPSFEHYSDRPNEVAYSLSHNLTVLRSVDVPPLEPLQAADLEGRLRLSGADFRPHNWNSFHISCEGPDQVRITSPLTQERTAQAQLTDEGRLVSESNGALLSQTLDDVAVRLKIRTGAQEVSLVHGIGDQPEAQSFDQPVPVKVEEDGSYTFALNAGALTVKPTLTLEEIAKRDDDY